MRLCSAIDQTPASFLRHLKDWPHRSVVLMQSSESEEGIFCHSSAPIVARFRVEGLGLGRVEVEIVGSCGERSFPTRVAHDARIVLRST
jgi:hypothetical protein